jgi:hypothetical protein
LEKLCLRIENARYSRIKLGATEWESGKMEVQWNNIKKCALGNTKDLVVEVDRKARKPWMT